MVLGLREKQVSSIFAPEAYIAAGESEAVDMEHIDKMSKALRKWSCVQCTYKNWPTVKTCTMCRAPRAHTRDTPGDDCSGELMHFRQLSWVAACCDELRTASGWSGSCAAEANGTENVTSRPTARTSPHTSANDANRHTSDSGSHLFLAPTEERWNVKEAIPQLIRGGSGTPPATFAPVIKRRMPLYVSVQHAQQCFIKIKPLNRLRLSSWLATASIKSLTTVVMETFCHGLWRYGIAGGGGRVNAASVQTERSGMEALTMTAKAMVPLDENLSFLERYIFHLQRSVRYFVTFADTGCCAFLEAVAEVMRPDCNGDEKTLQYIYQYGEGNRRITSFESVLLNGFDENGEQCLYTHTLIDLLHERRRDFGTILPKFFLDSICLDVDFPGCDASETSTNVYRNIRSKIRDDFDMRRIVNVGEHFILPTEVYNMKPWLAAGEGHLRVFLDFDERQIMKTICFGDTLSMDSLLGRNLYAPLLLRNRGGGHSLVDAASQAMWGVLDKNNVLRGAIYHTLYMKEAMFRSRWATALLKLGMKFDVWVMQRYWANIMDCHEPGTTLEQIHVLVLAQVLNRPIIVMPVESARLSSYLPQTSVTSVKHPIEGFYPQLPTINSYRCCAPLFLAFSNGNFYALMLPPPSRSPALSCLDAEGPSTAQIYRHARCPPIELADYVQFAIDENEAEKIVRESMMFDTDENGTRWFYHSMATVPYTLSDQSSILWSKYISEFSMLICLSLSSTFLQTLLHMLCQFFL
ncbi:unnamed protein product [Toxocara canis]|uniref:RanBP2-type domain-containing protein n=1 Tax=Toxocara canis TaxID=6265 RepID=A0A183UY32_TOXCA|nr:unnamed protein product [Toxocara canis]